MRAGARAWHFILHASAPAICWVHHDCGWISWIAARGEPPISETRGRFLTCIQPLSSTVIRVFDRAVTATCASTTDGYPIGSLYASISKPRFGCAAQPMRSNAAIGAIAARLALTSDIRLAVELSGARAGVLAWRFILHASAPAIC